LLLTRQAGVWDHCVITINRLSFRIPPQTAALAAERDCRWVILFEETPGRGYVKSVAPAGISGCPIIGREDDETAPLNEADTIRAMARAMHAQGLARWQKQLPFRIEALPKLSDYRQVLSGLLEMPDDATFVGRLYEGMRERWQQTSEAESADWLQFVLGITAGNRPRTLHLEASTESTAVQAHWFRPSELLMTMIVGMVVSTIRRF
jgi:hypothetical protein